MRPVCQGFRRGAPEKGLPKLLTIEILLVFLRNLRMELGRILSPNFLKKVFRKVLDAKGRVLEPLECGDKWM